MLAWLTSMAGKIGLTALYNVVKGFFDSWFEDRRRKRAIQDMRDHVTSEFEARRANETFKDYKERTNDRRKIEDAHRDDSWDDTRKRMDARMRKRRLEEGNKD